MHNEIPSSSENSLKMTKKYHSLLKEIGGNRLITYASHCPLTYVCLSYCDVISINQYLGWYGGDMTDWDGFIEKFRNRREELGLGNVPVIMSEFGAAALYGHHTFDDVHWTEEYQAKLFKYTLDLFMNDPMIVGYYVWQFCDIRTCLEAGINRARGFNNKGILNEHRKPKQAYYAVKNAFRRGEL
jgi:beta-glucuronidase